MKRILKAISGFAVVVAAVCLLSAPAQARVFVNVGFGFPFFYGPAYYPASAYYAPPAYTMGGGRIGIIMRRVGITITGADAGTTGKRER